MVTLALAQLRCEKAAVADNLAAIERVYRQADQQGACVVAWPEMSLTGVSNPRGSHNRRSDGQADIIAHDVGHEQTAYGAPGTPTNRVRAPGRSSATRSGTV